MLTKNDLNQIKNIVKGEINPVVNGLELVKKDIKVIKRDVSKLKRDQGTMLDLLDKEQMQQRKRIIRLEEHVGLPTPQ